MGCANGKLEPEAPSTGHLVETVYGGHRTGTRGGTGTNVAYTNAKNSQMNGKNKGGVAPPPDGGQPKTNKKVDDLQVLLHHKY